MSNTFSDILNYDYLLNAPLPNPTDKTPSYDRIYTSFDYQVQPALPKLSSEEAQLPISFSEVVNHEYIPEDKSSHQVLSDALRNAEDLIEKMIPVITAAKSDMTLLKLTILHLQKENMKFSQEKDILEKQQQDFQGKSQNYETEIAIMQREIDRLTADLLTLQGSEASAGNVVALRAELDAQNSKNAQMRSEIIILRNDIKTFKEHIAQLEQQNMQTTIQMENSQLREKIDDLNAIISDKDNIIAQLKNRLRSSK